MKLMSEMFNQEIAAAIRLQSDLIGMLMEPEVIQQADQIVGTMIDAIGSESPEAFRGAACIMWVLTELLKEEDAQDVKWDEVLALLILRFLTTKEARKASDVLDQVWK